MNDFQQPLNANAHNRYRRASHGPQTDETCCYPTPEDWCRRLTANYQPVYGWVFADISVFVANLFMLAFAIESLLRSDVAGEACEFPLASFVAVQCCLIVAVQLAAPAIAACAEGSRVARRPPTCTLVMHVLQLGWLAFGWLWTLQDSDCAEQAAYLYFAAWWLTVVYTVVVTLEMAWLVRSTCSAVLAGGSAGERTRRNDAYGAGKV
jgi:hypothetical protein